MAGVSRPELARNIKLLSHSDQGGRLDGVQVMVHRGYAYIGHLFSSGVTIVDVRDPRAPVTAGFIPAFVNTWTTHLQAHEDLLLVIDEYDFYKNPVFSEGARYYTSNVHETLSGAGVASLGRNGVVYCGGMRIYDISDPVAPRQIGQFKVDGLGFHRIWYVGGDYAYVSALLEGYTDHIFMVIDISNPSHPRELGRWWLPGMWHAGGEVPTWPRGDRYALHHAIVANGIAYGSWRDGGLTLLNVQDPAEPELLSHINWHPPFGGGTHTSLPLTDRVPNAKPYVIVADEAVMDNCADQVKYTWVVDVREPTNPVPVATLPTPAERDYCKDPGHFGPHNLHENRPGSFQSSDLVFATYQNAGVRVFDISNPHRPREVGAYVPAIGAEGNGTQQGSLRVDSTDVFVDQRAIMYVTDFHRGLHILEFLGAGPE
jgi:hypothetical protein